MASCTREAIPSIGILDNLLSPTSGDQFLRDYFGKCFLHLTGSKGKFSSLVPWNELNRVLEEHRIGSPRLRVVQCGKPIPVETYLSKPDSIGPRLRAPELTNLLAQGATLVVDAFDELYKPVRDLAVELERIFRICVQVNLYAGWRTDQGFLLHYDEHDTVILQVVGRKHWKVYRPTRLYPLEQGKDAEPAAKPLEEPIWDDILEDGGLLYIPRGWWHVAYPVDEPTLHLTVSLRNHRGLDVLIWFVKQLTNCTEVRQDIPHFADQDSQMAYMDKLRKQLVGRWSDDLLSRFLAEADAKTIMRPHFQLPDAATTEGVVVHRSSQVRLTGPRRIDLSGKAENGTRKFMCSRKTLYCCEAVLPVLERLNDGKLHAVQDLISIAPDQASNVLVFLQGLVLQGILTTAAVTAANSADVQGQKS